MAKVKLNKDSLNIYKLFLGNQDKRTYIYRWRNQPPNFLDSTLSIGVKLVIQLEQKAEKREEKQVLFENRV